MERNSNEKKIFELRRQYDEAIVKRAHWVFVFVWCEIKKAPTVFHTDEILAKVYRNEPGFTWPELYNALRKIKKRRMIRRMDDKNENLWLITTEFLNYKI